MNLVPMKWQIAGIDPKFAPLFQTLRIDRAMQIDGSEKYAVRFMSYCLNVEGEWEWEPMPSSRDDAFLARCRFDRYTNAMFMLEDALQRGLVTVNNWILRADGKVEHA